VFLPGDLFAVKSMFVMRHTDDVLILSDAQVERIHQRELHKALREDHDIADRCMWQVVEEERRLHSWVVGLGLGSSEERMALLLMDFHGRLARSGSIPVDSLRFQMPLTQVQLADHLGITAIHVNRVLKTFRESGIVTVRAGRVIITTWKSSPGALIHFWTPTSGIRANTLGRVLARADDVRLRNTLGPDR